MENQNIAVKEDTIKRFFDACRKAKRIADNMPKLPEGLTTMSMHVVDAIDILSKKGLVKISDLSTYLGVSRPAMTKIVNHLHELGILTKTNGQIDKRTVHVELTDLGKEYLDIYVRDYVRSMSKSLESIDEADFMATIDTVDRTYDIIFDR